MVCQGCHDDDLDSKVRPFPDLPKASQKLKMNEHNEHDAKQLRSSRIGLQAGQAGLR